MKKTKLRWMVYPTADSSVTQETAEAPAGKYTVWQGCLTCGATFTALEGNNLKVRLGRNQEIDSLTEAKYLAQEHYNATTIKH